MKLDTVHNQDCIVAMRRMESESIDLVFADPPFNIGYEYDVYDDCRDDDDFVSWCRDWMTEVVRVLKPDGTFWLAIGDEYAAELKVLMQRELQSGLPELGGLVLHVRRQLQVQVQPFARTPVPHGQGPAQVHLQRGRRARAVGAATGLRRSPGESPRAAAGRHLDPAAAGSAGRLPAAGRHLVFPPCGRHVQGTRPDSTAARCPSSCWDGSSAPAATKARSCSTRSPAAARRWPWPRNSVGVISASNCRPNTRG